MNKSACGSKKKLSSNRETTHSTVAKASPKNNNNRHVLQRDGLFETETAFSSTCNDVSRRERSVLDRVNFPLKNLFEIR